MERQKSKTALKLVLLLLLAVGTIISLLPYGAAAFRHRIYSFFGLTDFTDAADQSPLSVHVLDVGKADSILIECEGKYMLVDGGTIDCGEPVAEYLKRRGVKTLDYVVNTHPDSDHIGGLSEIIRRFSVEHYLAPAIPLELIPLSEEYRLTQEVLHDKSFASSAPKFGDTYFLGKLKIQVLGPLKTGTSTNNNSILLRLTYGNTHFLLMGDAEKEEEADLLASGADLTADVLKVGHHGSSTSTTAELIKAVQPRYAAISVADDTNHLPKNDVIKRLNDKGVQTFRTDIYGTILFLSDGHSVHVATEKKKP